MAITSFPNWHTLDLAQTLAESVDEFRHQSGIPEVSPIDHNDHNTPESLDIPHKPRGDKSLAEIQSWSGGNPGNPDLQGYSGQPGGIPELEGRSRESRESTQDGLSFPDFHGTQANPDINGYNSQELERQNVGLPEFNSGEKGSRELPELEGRSRESGGFEQNRLDIPDFHGTQTNPDISGYNSQELERQNVGLPEFNSGEKGSVPSYALPDAPGSIEAPGWQSTTAQPPIDASGWQGGAGSGDQEVSNWRGEVELPSPLAFPDFQSPQSAQVETESHESPEDTFSLPFPQFQAPTDLMEIGGYEQHPFFDSPAESLTEARTDETFWFE